MKLARKMVLPIHACISALYRRLFFRLMYPSRALMQDDRRIPKYMLKRIASRCFKEWQIIMGNDHPNLLAFLPRLMLLGRNQRTCSIPSLTEMTLFRHVDFYPRNIKLLRAMFSVCFDSGKSFALEFSAHDNRILVLKFTPRDGVIFMSTELYDRFSDIIRKTDENEVKLDCDQHLIDLNVKIDQDSSGIASFFYAHGVLLPFQMDNTGDFNIERYSLVSFWWGDEIKNFDRKCYQKLNPKRIRDCEHPSYADSKRRKE